MWQTVFDASYLVMASKCHHLGAPVEYALDPAIGWSPPNTTRREHGRRENSVGIGGAYLCVYGMEGPAAISLSAAPCGCGIAITGGRFCRQATAAALFDQLRFYPVSAEELLAIRRDFPRTLPLRIEHSTLRLAEYQQFLSREGRH